jgi:hypothetical protein
MARSKAVNLGSLIESDAPREAARALIEAVRSWGAQRPLPPKVCPRAICELSC